MEVNTYKLGIDIGSTTLKICLLDKNNRLNHCDYRRHNASPEQTAIAALERMKEKVGDCQMAVRMTGSVGMGYAERMGIAFEQEVIAAGAYVKRFHPDIHTLIDLGGEDAKMIFFDEGRMPDMRMNGSCAGGTGSFIDQTATLLGIETDELDALAAHSQTVYPIASRCGVFSKTDIQNLLARGVGKSDIAASMFRAVALQVMTTLARGVDVTPRVLLCGGPFAFMPQMRKAMQVALGMTDDDCFVPEHPHYVPAMGCAVVADGITIGIDELAERFAQTQPIVTTNSSTLDSLFASHEEYATWQESKHGYEAPLRECFEAGDYWLGVDSGSTTTKLVLIDAEGRIAFKDYSFNEGDSYHAFKRAMERMHAAAANPQGVNIVASAVTGYGEGLLKSAFALDHGIVETVAHFTAAKAIDPEVSFVLDIGGQDMKAIYVEHGSIRRIEINEACSSGCGSFIMTFAGQLGYNVADFARMACFAPHPYDLGTRCTVFMNSKVKQAMNEGARVDDIAAGFSYSVVKNCLFKVLKMHSTDELGNHIVVQGGTFKNHSVARALEKMTGCKVRFSDIPELAGAYGSALYALSKSKEQ